MVQEQEYFLKTHKYSVFKNHNIYYIYIYNNNFIFLIKVNPQTQLKIISNRQFKFSRTLLKNGSHCFKALANFIDQFDRYVYTKIKFTGKGYKIRKRNHHSMILVFNRAHTTIIWWKNIILKKIKKNKFYVKLTAKNLHFINTVINVRRINIFTKKGLRTSRQMLLKKKGKKV